jgi:ribosomal protein S18 acetylase RimI-like enzyme
VRYLQYGGKGLTTQWGCRETDHQALVRISRRFPATRAFSAMWFSGAENYAKQQIRVARLDDQLVGFSMVHERVRPPAVATLHFLAVSPECHRRGVASILLQELEQNTRHPVVVLNVLRSNEAAVALYHRHGYQIVGPSLEGQGHRMEKELTK